MKLSVAALLVIFISAIAHATPPEYASFERTQKPHHALDIDETMRIWIPYVGQGDGMLIQMPRKFQYELEMDGLLESRTEFIDIVVDAGTYRRSDQTRFRDFLDRVYPAGAIIEYVVISHHDMDHVAGFTPMLADPNFGVEYIYHNGLASYAPGQRGFPASGEPPGEFILTNKSASEVRRWMAMIEDEDRLRATDLIADLETLNTRHAAGELQGVYQHLAQAILMIRDTSTLDESYAVARDFRDRAVAALDVLPDNADRAALTDIAGHMIERRS